MKVKDLEKEEQEELINRFFNTGYSGTIKELLEIDIMTDDDVKKYIDFLESKNYD